MSEYITEEEYEEVKRLIEIITGVSSKAKAAPYLERLDFLSHHYSGYTGIVFSDLVCSAKCAAGQVADKERKLFFCNQDLFKLGYRVKKDGNH